MNKTLKKKIIPIVLLFLISNLFGQNDLPKIYSGDPGKILSLRKAYLNGELKNDASIKYLKRQADKLLDMAPLSVIEKKQTPPSGDKHDYMSMSKYWWPNPDTKDGMPYLRKDGEVNPESEKIKDPSYVGKLISSVEILSIAFYITNESKYSEKASQLLRVWFLNESTKMNPNLNYAQSVKGKNEGTKSGIIDVNGFHRLIDAIGLLETSKEWTTENKAGIKKWISEFLIWLRTSKNGVEESKSKNNHGTWYDVQLVSCLLYLDKNEEAKEHLESISKKRFDSQIEADGKQPVELARTNGMSYTLFNLRAFFKLSLLAEKVKVDLWNYKSNDGGSIRNALDYFLPFVLDPDKWEYKQISPFNKKDMYPLLLIAQKKYDDKIYSEWIEKIFGDKIRLSIDNFL
jgi:hypothetical protein